MIKRLRIIHFTTALMLICSSAFAQLSSELQEVVLTGNVFGRVEKDGSLPDFSKNAQNIKTVVTTGSKGTVLETTPLSTSGSYGVKIRLTEVGKGKTNAKPGDEVWVHYSKKNPWLSFRDTKDIEVQEPDKALTAKAKKSGEAVRVENSDDKSVDPNLAMPSDHYGTEAGTSGNCTLTNSCSQTTMNQNHLRDLANKVDDTKSAPAKKVEKKTAKKDKATAAATSAMDEQPYWQMKKHKYTMTESDWSNFPEITKYSNSDKTKRMISYGMRNKEKWSTGWCYRYVKKAIQKGQGVGSLPGGQAKDAVRDLKRQGFKNLMDAPYKGIIRSADDAPKGAIIVYATSANMPGDVQIKTGWGDNGGYVSDFYTENNFLKGSPRAKYFRSIGKPYKIIGVMIKP